MRRRLGAAMALVLLLAAALLWLRQASSPVLAMAGTLNGTRWYRVELADERIGSYRASTRRRAGRIEFASQLTATLPGGDPFSVTERLRFDASPPFALLDATYSSGTTSRSRTVTIERNGTHYHASVDIAAIRSEQTLDIHYTLTDHLGLELWLRRETPPVGAERRVPSLDFERLEPLARQYRVLQRYSDGYAIARTAPLTDQIVLLDAHLIPQALSLAGLFTLTRSTEAVRDEPNRSRSHADYTRVKLAGEIPRATDVRRLTLAVNRAAGTTLESRPGLSLSAEGGHWTLVSEPARAPSAADNTADDAATTQPGDDDPRLLALLERARRGAPDPLAELTRLVHDYLDYDDASHSLGLADTLQSRRGDCTEFADLLAALARAAGYRARTVTGLVYSDAESPAFMLHAWTEVFDDGYWRGLDPTWNEARLDATHLPLPDSNVGYLRAYAALPQMRFEVERVEY